MPDYLRLVALFGIVVVNVQAIAFPTLTGLDRPAGETPLGPGVVLGLTGAALWQWGPAVPGVVLVMATAPIATLGYLGLIAALSRPPGPVMARALAAGGSSLSIYLGQSIILSTVFAGYGLGLWDAVDRLTAVLVAVGATVALIVAISVWRRRFALGPLDWVLRRITHAGLPA